MGKTNKFKNDLQFVSTYNRLKNIAISSIDYENMPDEVDIRYLENALFYSSGVVFFEIIPGERKYAVLTVMPHGKFNIYGYPTERTGYSNYNRFRVVLNQENSVIIYNNYARTNTATDCKLYAERIANLERTIDVNINAQKRPYILNPKDEATRVALSRLYMDIMDNSPVLGIQKRKNKNGDFESIENDISVFNLNAPFVADKLFELKKKFYNDWLSYLGLPNSGLEKKAQINSEESMINNGGYMTESFTRLASRIDAFNKINKKFGLNIKPYYRYTRTEAFYNLFGDENEEKEEWENGNDR